MQILISRQTRTATIHVFGKPEARDMSAMGFRTTLHMPRDISEKRLLSFIPEIDHGKFIAGRGFDFHLSDDRARELFGKVES